MTDSSTLFSPAHFIESLIEESLTLDPLLPLPTWGQYDFTSVMMFCSAIRMALIEHDHFSAFQLCQGDSALAVAVREWIWANMHLQAKAHTNKEAQLRAFGSVIDWAKHA